MIRICLEIFVSDILFQFFQERKKKRIKIKEMREGTIFVSIASYRDKICPITIESIFKMAKHPDKVFIGICQQNDTGDVDCLEKGLESLPGYRHNVRIIRLRHNEAKGPTYARYLCSTLYDKEEYYLQIDSHCLFIRDWDVILIKMITDLKKSGIPNPVLSTYTPNYEDYTENPDPKSQVTTICQAWFTDQNLISLYGAGWTDPGELPRPNAFIAAGMFFAESRFLKDIPFDPDLDFVFIGEELLLSARFYTHGWDIHTPRQNVIYHMYTREKDPKFWENAHLDSEQALHKIRYLMSLDPDDSKLSPRQKHFLSIYGLGDKRKISDYLDYAGIDIPNKKINKNMCDTPAAELQPAKTTTEQHSSSLFSIFFWIIVFVICVLIIRQMI